MPHTIPPLAGCPHTMLWTLHNRAQEAMRPDAWLVDPHAVRVYQSIDFDFMGQFGWPDGSHAVRSLMFDQVVTDWLQQHPHGAVVELACGLETQFLRVDNGQVCWTCIDLPESMAVRERFLPPSARCHHRVGNALDLHWMDGIISCDQPVLISMQGLLMYLDEAEVQRLLLAALKRFPGCTVVFDTIPRWLSRQTQLGWWLTWQYRCPAMPWGVDRDEIPALVQKWGLPMATVTEEPICRFRSVQWQLVEWMTRTPWGAKQLPAVVSLTGR